MRNIIVGTAGHIDHGKTALVRALTGIETDRLAEEKRRGISIDLGFAHWESGSGIRFGFIDVPGHERFVKNMLAGAGGIDLVLLVIGADESIKPQTREHFEICRLLGIKAGIVVLTKADLVDSDILELVKLEAEEFVAGSFLEGAPILPVSSKTGEGLPELKKALEALAAKVSAKSAAGYLRLPIDRSFSMRGFGTVVTGTLVSGRAVKEAEVEVQPAGLKVRVRGVQVHGSAANEAVAGQRTALNVAGVEAAELGRGMTIVEPGTLTATQVIDCKLQLLASAKALKHRAPVHFHAWTAETEAEVRLLNGAERLKPGSEAIARLQLREPVLLVPGDRFIIRMFSPVETIGGGQVIDIQPPAKLRKALAHERAEALLAGSLAQRVERLVKEAGPGVELGQLAARLGVPVREIQPLVKAGPFLVAEGWVVAREWADKALAAIRSRLAQFHKAQPLQPGIAKEEIRTRELAGAPDRVVDLLLGSDKGIVVEGEAVRLASHTLRLKDDEAEATARVEQAFAQAGLAVPAVTEVLKTSGVEPARARALLQILFRQKRLVRVSEELVFHPDALAALRATLAARKGQRFGVGEFKEWTGVSRKYAIPLLEFLDRERVTRREGDQRIVN